MGSLGKAIDGTKLGMSLRATANDFVSITNFRCWAMRCSVNVRRMNAMTKTKATVFEGEA